MQLEKQGILYKSKQHMCSSGRHCEAVWVWVLSVHGRFVRKPVWLENKDRLVGWSQIIKDWKWGELRLVDLRKLTLNFVLKCDYRDLFAMVTWAVWFGDSERLVTRHLSVQAGAGKDVRGKWRWKRRRKYVDFQRNNYWGNWLDLVGREKKVFKVGSKGFNLRHQAQKSLSLSLNFFSCQD